MNSMNECYLIINLRLNNIFHAESNRDYKRYSNHEADILQKLNGSIYDTIQKFKFHIEIFEIYHCYSHKKIYSTHQK